MSESDHSLHRISAFVDMTANERSAMLDLIGPVRSFDVAENIRVEGDEMHRLYFLHEGWVLSSIVHPNGSRQVLKVHRSGDILGAPSLPFETAVETLITLTTAKISAVPLYKLGAIFAKQPRLAAVLFLSCQEERVTLMDRLAVAGRLSAKHSVAKLLLLLFDERPPSDGTDVKLHIPLTQSQIADVLGLSAVHVNRSLMALEEEGLLKRDGTNGRSCELPNISRLKSLVGLPERTRRRNPAWLPTQVA